MRSSIAKSAAKADNPLIDDILSQLVNSLCHTLSSKDFINDNAAVFPAYSAQIRDFRIQLFLYTIVIAAKSTVPSVTFT